MKSTLVLIWALCAATVLCRKPLFTIPIFGYTDIDAENYGEGLASGFLGKDVRSQYSSCIDGFPEIVTEFTDLINDLTANFVNPAELVENFGKLQKIVNFVFDMIKKGPKDVKGCQELASETTYIAGWFVKHISITTVTTGLVTNIVTNLFTVFTDAWGLVTDMFGKNYYQIGKDEGELAMLLLN